MRPFTIIMDVNSAGSYLGLSMSLRNMYGLNVRFIEKKIDFEQKENPRFCQDGIARYVPDSVMVQYVMDSAEADFVITDKLIGMEGFFEIVPAGGEGRELGGFASSYIFGGDAHLTSKVVIHEVGHMRGLKHCMPYTTVGLKLDDKINCVMIPYRRFCGGISVADFTTLQSPNLCMPCKTKLVAKDFTKGLKEFFH